MMQPVRRKTSRRATAIIFAAAMGAIALPTSRQATAGTDSWIGTSGGNWTDGSQWSNAMPPGAGDNVYITNAFSGTQIINFDTDSRLGYNSLSIDAVSGGTNVFSNPGNYLAVGGNETVGVGGNGILNQLAGVNHTLQLILGYSAGSTGTYTLGTAATLYAGNFSYQGNFAESIGNSGVGIFNQIGGNNNASNGINLGSQTNSVGIYNQSGGTNTIASGFDLKLGCSAGATGNYTLGSSATLLVSNAFEYVGYSGLGNFNQTGGSNSVYNGEIDIAYNAGSTGTYTLASGGTLSTLFTQEFVGRSGAGNFNQTGGTHAITNGALCLSNVSGSTSTYTLGTGATLQVNNSSEYVGANGVGNFNQTGGSHNISNTSIINEALFLGFNSGSIGNYTLGSGASLVADQAQEYVGYLGVGNFSQIGGTNILFIGKLDLGYDSAAIGNYVLSGGNLSSSEELVGDGGVGNFNQTGGTNSTTYWNNTTGDFYVGYQPGSTGNYTLSGGALIAAFSYEYIGFGGMGNFNQTGGVNSPQGSTLYIGFLANSTGTYTLSAGAELLPTNSFEAVGGAGTGFFNQFGGTNAIGSLAIGLGVGSTGTYNLSGGNLGGGGLFSGESIGNSGTGFFNQTGGANTIIGGALTIGELAKATGTYTLTGGILSAPNVYVGGSAGSAGGSGFFVVNSSGQFTVANTLKIWKSGSMTVNASMANGSMDSVGSLQIATGGLLTLNSSALTINYGTAASPNATIRNYISNGYHGGSLWTGTTGITSATAAADPAHHSVAFADGADGVVTHLPAGISSAIPTGGTLPAGSEVVTYAFAGDANLDGKVDFLDFIVLSNHFGASDTNWDNGNFNYDSIVDFSDFIVLSNNFGAGTSLGNGTGATPQELAQYNALAEKFGISQSQIAAWDATIANLPEPASAGLLIGGAAALLLRRRSIRTKPSMIAFC